MNALQRLLWWLIAGSKGGGNRKRILETLYRRPMNLHQLAKELEVDYTTIQHHIKILVKNNLVIGTGKKYGAMYFISDYLNDHWEYFEEISDKIGNT